MPKKIDFPSGYLNQTYATFRNAFKNGRKMAESSGQLGFINLSSILTTIIHEVGRFSENYTSDALYGMKYIKTLCCSTYLMEHDIDEIFVFGVRRNGVHYNGSVMQTLYQYVNPFCPWLLVQRDYRKVLACRVTVTQDEGIPDVTCELRDITDSLHRTNPADLDENGKLRICPFPDGNPIPLPLYPESSAAV